MSINFEKAVHEEIKVFTYYQVKIKDTLLMNPLKYLLCSKFGFFKTDKKIGYKELTKRLDAHIAKTLTDSLKNHLEQLSKRVLKFISQEYTKVQSAQFQWIIARKESDGGKEVSQIQLIDIKNVIFINW